MPNCPRCNGERTVERRLGGRWRTMPCYLCVDQPTRVAFELMETEQLRREASWLHSRLRFEVGQNAKLMAYVLKVEPGFRVEDLG